MTGTFGEEWRFAGALTADAAGCGSGGLRRSLGRGRELASRAGVPLSPRRPGLSPVSSKRGSTVTPSPQWV